MNPADPLSRIPCLYHFTDRRNLPLIESHGGLLPATELAKRGIAVPAPGGNDWSREADGISGMGRYVHLCFRPAHPMEFLARREGRIGDTIFLQIHPSVLQFPGTKFTADVANKSGVTACTIEDAKAIIDFEILYTRTDWTKPAIKERLRKAEKYEVLVAGFIPKKLIRNFPNG